MKHKIWPAIKKGAVTISLAAGVLSIANVENIWQEYQSQEHLEQNRFLAAAKDPSRKAKPHAKLPINDERAAVKPLQSELSRSFEDDEILDANPFAHLSTLEPLQKIMQKGVAHFQRETLRSSDYQEESGYDILSYEIEHSDGTKSEVMAYLEKKDPNEVRNIGAPDTRTVFVVVMVANGPTSDISFFRGGELIQQSALSTSEAQALVSNRLSEGVPFLSVSR
jgi:hypothetical protein